MNSSSTHETKAKLRVLLSAKDNVEIYVSVMNYLLMDQCKKDVDNTIFKTISFKNETPFEIEIYYKKEISMF